MSASRPPIPEDQIVAFCRKWKVQELSLFGSILRDDFSPDSDVDVLVSFLPHAELDLDVWLAMQDELEKIFGRKVDLVSKRAIRNPFRRREILTRREVVYAA